MPLEARPGFCRCYPKPPYHVGIVGVFGKLLEPRGIEPLTSTLRPLLYVMCGSIGDLALSESGIGVTVNA